MRSSWGNALVALVLAFTGRAFGASPYPREKPLITVPLGVAEALADGDARAPQSFRRGYESALFYALGTRRGELAQCGYRIELHMHQYKQGEALAPREAADALVSSGAWFAIGPSNSVHYLLFAQGLAGRVGSVSLNASSSQVHALAPPVFTIYPTTPELARSAIAHARKDRYGTTFASFVAAECLSCRDFEREFIAQSKGIFEKKWQESFVGTAPDLTRLAERLRAERVDFLLLPNSSKPTGHVLTTLAAEFTRTRVVGMDGWGGPGSPLLKVFPIPENVQGFCVRGTLPAPESDRDGPLGLLWQNSPQESTYSMQALDESVKILTQQLCLLRPSSREAFLKGLEKRPADLFRKRTFPAVFRLKGNTLTPVALDEPKARTRGAP